MAMNLPMTDYITALTQAGVIIGALAATSIGAAAQSYPSQVIRIVVPTAPSTPPDIISRVLANELQSLGELSISDCKHVAGLATHQTARGADQNGFFGRLISAHQPH
jgi:hypothetical protein